jgi:AraC-like DNA-binding protein
MSALSKADRNSERSRDPAEFPDAPPGLPADLTRTLGWLRSHLAEPVQLDLLAQIAGVRPRTLETHFKMFLGTTPLGWVRRMRLARAPGIAARESADQRDRCRTCKWLQSAGSLRRAVPKAVRGASVSDASAKHKFVDKRLRSGPR